MAKCGIYSIINIKYIGDLYIFEMYNSSIHRYNFLINESSKNIIFCERRIMLNFLGQICCNTQQCASVINIFTD